MSMKPVSISGDSISAGGASPAGAFGRRQRGRVAPLANTVALTEADSYAAQFVSGLNLNGWLSATFPDIEAAARHTSIRETRLLIIGGNSFGWVIRALHATRQTGGFQIAILGSFFSQEEMMLLLGAGANLVIEDLSNPDEVLARLTAICHAAEPEKALDVRWLKTDRLSLDLSSRRCFLDGEKVHLSQNEFDLLAYLMARSEEVVPSEKIAQDLWNLHSGDSLNVLRLNIGRLRKKLGDSSSEPVWIESARGIGYQFLQQVAEVGQDRSEDRLRQTVATLNAQQDGLSSLLDSLLVSHSVHEVAEHVVNWAIDHGFCDASTMFRFVLQRDGSSRSELIESAGMSRLWRQELTNGHPVEDGFVGTYAFLRGEVVQLSDMTKLSNRFPVTARMSSAEDLHACLIFPLFVNGTIWGDIGFLSREKKAFPPARTRYLRSVASMVSLALRYTTSFEHDLEELHDDHA